MSHSLTPFFSPTGIVLIGASADPTKLGYGLARNLAQSHFRGALHFVNPRAGALRPGGALLGRPIYPRVADVPDPVDLAILLIPAPGVLAALRECAQRDIRAAIIGSGGFRETGPEGAALEAECLRLAEQVGMRLIGPNCIGLLDTHLPLDATFLPPPGPLPGDVAFLSHSGAICAAVIDWARGQGFGLSRMVSLGNQADVCETDLLAPTAADAYTRVITLYLEGVKDGRRFVEEASRVTRLKPIVALKVGRSTSGQRAAASHTGALAGAENAYDAAFQRAGVIRANTSEELFDWARALAWCPLPPGRAIAVLTNAGGPGVTAADALEANGLKLADLQDATVADLRQRLPPAASLRNPVDMLASASPEQFAACLHTLLADPGVDGALVIFPSPPVYAAGAVAKALIPVIHGADKPVTVALMGERLIQEAVEYFRAARVAEYRFPERAASALAILAQRAEYLQRAAHDRLPLEQSPDFPTVLDGKAPEHAALPERSASLRTQSAEALKSTIKSCGVSPEALRDLLAAYGIPTPPIELVASPEQAAAAAERLGFPVTLKIASPDILHKSDVDGVLLDLEDGAAVAHGYTAMLARVRLARPQAQLLGAQVQPMIPPGQEVIVGAVQDAQFGPLVMFGSGGVEVEGLKDIAFALAPLDRQEAERLLDQTWAGRRLRGYRSLPPADREAVIDVVLRLAQLAQDFPDLSEIEINPLRVLAQGAWALDGRVRIKPV